MDQDGTINSISQESNTKGLRSSSPSQPWCWKWPSSLLSQHAPQPLINSLHRVSVWSTFLCALIHYYVAYYLPVGRRRYDLVRTFTTLTDLLRRSDMRELQEIWYRVVKDYSRKQLSFSDDKLPALSGIASRFHCISKDAYVAGHWRTDLERSLFWKPVVSTFRVKSYRAPTWSWASMDGMVEQSTYGWETSFRPPPDAVKVLDVEIQVEGENPFGRVSSGRIVVKANIIEARWVPEAGGWVSSCYGPGLVHRYKREPLIILGRDGHLAGSWMYDDERYGVMPGPLLKPDAVQAEVEPRLVPRLRASDRDDCEEFDPILKGIYKDDERDGDVGSFWSRATYVPEDLLLMKGPTKRCFFSHETSSEKNLDVIHVLVLKKKHGDGHEYERVGIGALSSWDKSVETRQTLTIV